MTAVACVTINPYESFSIHINQIQIRSWASGFARSLSLSCLFVLGLLVMLVLCPLSWSADARTDAHSCAQMHTDACTDACTDVHKCGAHRCLAIS